MNNPGMDLEIWKQLREKWADLDAKGHKLKIDFQLIEHPMEEHDILAIDVVQYIDEKPVTETVQRCAREAYALLGIEDLSIEQLTEAFKKMMSQLRSQSKLNDVDVVVTMTLTSPTSGELQGRFEVPNAPVQSNILVNYQHYYVLSALRDKMIELRGEPWNKVAAVYHAGELEFDFDYS
jgi:hypothetical protein